jgi:hypothetical protein
VRVSGDEDHLASAVEIRPSHREQLGGPCARQHRRPADSAVAGADVRHEGVDLLRWDGPTCRRLDQRAEPGVVRAHPEPVRGVGVQVFELDGVAEQGRQRREGTVDRRLRETGSKQLVLNREQRAATDFAELLVTAPR